MTSSLDSKKYKIIGAQDMADLGRQAWPHAATVTVD
jgi:hypothetical protein